MNLKSKKNDMNIFRVFFKEIYSCNRERLMKTLQPAFWTARPVTTLLFK